MTNDEKPIGVAVLGLGNVGSEVVRIINESASDLAARIGAPLELRGIGVRRVAADRGVPVELLTDDITPGDLLGVAATGAYCYSMSSRYNLIGRPAVVAVRNGQARLILRRETVDDLLSLEVR